VLLPSAHNLDDLQRAGTKVFDESTLSVADRNMVLKERYKDPSAAPGGLAMRHQLPGLERSTA
jgi:hypothetical protein